MKKVVFVSTVAGIIPGMKEAFAWQFPDVQLINLLDDGIIPEITENGGKLTPDIIKRVADYGVTAERYGASAAVCMCTTIAPAVDAAQPAVGIPYLKIDGPMLERAATMGDRIALLVTAELTFGPSTQSARKAAEKMGRGQVQIDTILVEGAWAALNLEGDKAAHDRLIVEKAREVAGSYDVIVLEQASMVDAASALEDLGVPVLTSVEMGIAQLAQYL